MPPPAVNESCDLNALVERVGEVLSQVAEVTEVSSAPGGAASWAKQKEDADEWQQTFWEVDIQSAAEQLYAAPRYDHERPVLRIDGFMPWRLDPPASAFYWRDVLRKVKDVLRQNETLLGLVVDSELPQLTTNELVVFEEGEKRSRCHHCIIILEVRHDFQYTSS